MPNDGTKIWCDGCQDWTYCKGLSPAEVSFLPSDRNQRWSHTEHEDLHWFKRGRRCKTCNHEFMTVEIEEDRLWELAELRDALAEIKANAEAYVAQSAAAKKTLGALTKSLGVLRALDLYKAAGS